VTKIISNQNTKPLDLEELLLLEMVSELKLKMQAEEIIVLHG